MTDGVWIVSIMDRTGEVREFAHDRARTADELIELFNEIYPYEQHGFVLAGRPYLYDLPF